MFTSITYARRILLMFIPDFNRGDGDFGKLGRGGSEGCFIPQPIERLTDVGVIQIECGAQFSLALTKVGEIWTWGKVRKNFHPLQFPKTQKY